MTLSVTHEGILFEVEYDFEKGYSESMIDPGVEDDIECTAILHDGVDLYDLLSDSAITSIIRSAREQAIDTEREAV